MPNPETLEELIFRNADCKTNGKECWLDNGVEVASLIREWVIKKLPKKKEIIIRSGKPSNSRYNKLIIGYNQALSDCQQAIKEEE